MTPPVDEQLTWLLDNLPYLLGRTVLGIGLVSMLLGSLVHWARRAAG